MSVCVRLAKDVVAEFRDVADTVEFLSMLGIAHEPGQAVESAAAKAVSVKSFEPAQTASIAVTESCADGVATSASLAQLQGTADLAAAIGCRPA